MILLEWKAVLKDHKISQGNGKKVIQAPRLQIMLSNECNLCLLSNLILWAVRNKIKETVTLSN